MVPGLYIILKKENDRDHTEITTYQQLIEKLLYIACKTHPNITFVVGCLSQQCSDPQIDHTKVIRRVLQHLKRTINLEIHYNSLYNDMQHLLMTLNYMNSNFTEDISERKSIMGYCFFLVRGVISWCLKKQHIVSTSTTEAEYITIGHAIRQAV